MSLRDEEGNEILSVTSRKDYTQSVFSCPEMEQGKTYSVYIDENIITDVTLNGMINKAAADGGAFTGGYPRGHW